LHDYLSKEPFKKNLSYCNFGCIRSRTNIKDFISDKAIRYKKIKKKKYGFCEKIIDYILIDFLFFALIPYNHRKYYI